MYTYTYTFRYTYPNPHTHPHTQAYIYMIHNTDIYNIDIQYMSSNPLGFRSESSTSTTSRLPWLPISAVEPGRGSRSKNFECQLHVFGFFWTHKISPGNMSCRMKHHIVTNFQFLITRVVAFKKRGQFQGFQVHLLPCASLCFQLQLVLRLKQLKILMAK